MFLYFVPNVTADNFRESPAFVGGLAAILGTEAIQTKELRFGPAGKDVPGLLLCSPPLDGTMPTRLMWTPDKQTWQDCGEYWIGYETANPPHPEMLLRSKTIAGYSYTLGDGREYLCPIVRRMAFQPMLPCSLQFDGVAYTRVVQPEFEQLWVDSERWSKALTDTEKGLAAVRCLQLNYRVGPWELQILGTFAAESAANDVILAALDEQFFLDCLNDPKKKQWIENVSSVLASVSHGIEETCANIAPAAAN